MSEWQPQIKQAIDRLDTAFRSVERAMSNNQSFSEDLHMAWNHADHIAKMIKCWQVEEKV